MTSSSLSSIIHSKDVLHKSNKLLLLFSIDSLWMSILILFLSFPYSVMWVINYQVLCSSGIGISYNQIWRVMETFPMRVCLSTLYSIDLIYWMLKYWMDEYEHEGMHYPDHCCWWNRGKMNMKMESEDFVLYTVVSVFSIFSLLCWHHLLPFM